MESAILPISNYAVTYFQQAAHRFLVWACPAQLMLTDVQMISMLSIINIALSMRFIQLNRQLIQLQMMHILTLEYNIMFLNMLSKGCCDWHSKQRPLCGIETL